MVIFSRLEDLRRVLRDSDSTISDDDWEDVDFEPEIKQTVNQSNAIDRDESPPSSVTEIDGNIARRVSTNQPSVNSEVDDSSIVVPANDESHPERKKEVLNKFRDMSHATVNEVRSHMSFSRQPDSRSTEQGYLHVKLRTQRTCRRKSRSRFTMNLNG